MKKIHSVRCLRVKCLLSCIVVEILEGIVYSFFLGTIEFISYNQGNVNFQHPDRVMCLYFGSVHSGL